MNALHIFAIVLASCSPAWPDACLLWWLWRHRRVQPLPRMQYRNVAANTPRPRANLKCAKVRKKLLYLCARLDRAGCRTIADVYNCWHGGWTTICKTSVWKFRREHDTEIQRLRRQRKRRRPHFVPAGQAWALDLTLIRSPFGISFTVLGILDAGSRKLMRLQVLPTKCAIVVLGHLLIAAGTHGLPAVIRTDNETMFTSRLWQATLKSLGIAHRRGPPRQPWRNGRIERFFGTLKTALRGLRFGTARELQTALDRFAHWYDQCRPHQGIDGLVPEEVWQARPSIPEWHASDDRGHRAQILRGLLEWHRWRCRQG
jgi:transposase InsO family protein